MSEHMAALRTRGPLKDAPLHQAALWAEARRPPTGATRRREKSNSVQSGSLDGLPARLPSPESWLTLNHPRAMNDLPIPLSRKSHPISPQKPWVGKQEVEGYTHPSLIASCTMHP